MNESAREQIHLFVGWHPALCPLSVGRRWSLMQKYVAFVDLIILILMLQSVSSWCI